jgi:hypothetical protein
MGNTRPGCRRPGSSPQPSVTALRAEQRLDTERERHDGLLAVLTSADEDARPAAGGPAGSGARRAQARGTAWNWS